MLPADKHCAYCDKWFPRTVQFFYRNPHLRNGGFSTYCIGCERERRRVKYADSAEYREHVKGIVRRWRIWQREGVKA